MLLQLLSFSVLLHPSNPRKPPPMAHRPLPLSFYGPTHPGQTQIFCSCLHLVTVSFNFKGHLSFWKLFVSLCFAKLPCHCDGTGRTLCLAMVSFSGLWIFMFCLRVVVDIFKFIGFRTSRRPGFIHFRICASYGTFNAKRDNTAGCGYLP